ncbi:uncharacterized protein LOC134541917 isoform X2 [Bacillus rossius redtenbacheri]|uniref:uncharacterized protein LOC134541917 isoform X2 n=1 Tax=Bacillus rossius redtenbacheri TaxID=93214 RepID=UPI002FDD6227
MPVATLGSDLPSPDQWRGARHKKRRAPPPPTPPTGSRASSRTNSPAATDESLQVLVSQIQQEFGEHRQFPRRHDRSTTPGASAADETGPLADKAFVVEPRVCPTPTPDKPGDGAEDGNTATKDSRGSGEVLLCGATDTSEDPKQDGEALDDPSKKAPDKEVTVHANVFVQTTSRTISRDGEKITVTASDDRNSSDTAANENETTEKPYVATESNKNQSNSGVLDQRIINDQNSDKLEVSSSVTGDAVKVSHGEVSTNEGQVETVSEHYECGVFVVSTPDTASVYEDAASDEDIDESDDKPAFQEPCSLDSNKKTTVAIVDNWDNSVPAHTESDVPHDKIMMTSVLDKETHLETTSSKNPSKTHSTVTPRNVIPDITTTSCKKTINEDASSKEVSIEKTPNESLNSVHLGNDQSYKDPLKNAEESLGATSDNESSLMPRKDVKSHTNGEVLRKPVTAPRNKSSNGLVEESSSTAKAAPSDSSSRITPTAPPRNKPLPVPRMKRLRKLFSNH